MVSPNVTEQWKCLAAPLFWPAVASCDTGFGLIITVTSKHLCLGLGSEGTHCSRGQHGLKSQP
jgi:hypothetical protein